MNERPIECSECKKDLTVNYSQIVGQKMHQWKMCADCPVLEKKMGAEPPPGALSPKEQDSKLLKCPSCLTTQETLQTGGITGCAKCYEVFEELIAKELVNLAAIPPTTNQASVKLESLHFGKEPGKTRTLSPSIQLIALNEALDETLLNEDYEQAAKLRDQIKQLTEEQNGK
ncbi:MAG: UvrB/UvrC motif-containing protein [Chlamydiales bacterium]|nr:UvrB/UvrC motif-containing protein [Chlamydiales bacterium]